MKRFNFLFVCLLVYVVSSAQGFLKAKDGAIVNEKGEKIILRGMGLGGWMLQEGYMFRLSNLGQQYRIKAKIEEVVGAEKAKQFYDQWLTNHTTKKDMDYLAKNGFNSIRLPMHYRLYTLSIEEEPVKGKQTWIEKGFALTDSLLNWCKANNMYLILDLHAAPGGQGHDLPISDRDPSKPSLWESDANKQKTIALWRKLAERYANEPWIGGYDIINEPNWSFTDTAEKRGLNEKNNGPLEKLMIDITKAIREVDKKHIIIIEGNGFGNNYNGITPTWDDNLVMSFHKYGNFNTQNQIQKFLDLRTKYNIPLWLGESGENSNTWFTEAIGLVESHGIGWAWWQHKKMGINNPLEIRQPYRYTELREYWAGRGTKPTEEEAWKVLQDLLENVKIENNIVHPDVTDAMIRQVHSTETKPFAYQSLNSTGGDIRAVDFDMGRQRYAYYDKDSARYQYTPGVNTDGNRGRAYRNDGVDIINEKGYYVNNFEESEWLQYTVNVLSDAQYILDFRIAADSIEGKFSFIADDKIVMSNITAPVIKKDDYFPNVGGFSLRLTKGVHVFRVRADKGSLKFDSIRFRI